MGSWNEGIEINTRRERDESLTQAFCKPGSYTLWGELPRSWACQSRTGAKCEMFGFMKGPDRQVERRGV